ncbi:MAG: TIGR00296 family protein [Methanosphaera sp.]|nr:TIGR00296 family protein [Methanosphaera sp.]
MSNDILTQKEGQLLLEIARDNINTYLNNKEYEPPSNLPEIFNTKRGVFVTLNKNGDLRGCIGYPEGYKPLIDALLDVSISAATRDPRFRPLTIEEYNDITIEVSVLTQPEQIVVDNYKDYLEKIVIGRDGLIIEYGFNRGLLLPQVPIEQGWDVEEYLSYLCLKANLDVDTWMEDSVKIDSFQAQVFSE